MPIYWTRQQLLSGALLLLATAYFALWACAPVSSMPSMIGTRDNARGDFGIAGSYSRATEEVHGGSNAPSLPKQGYDGQLWAARRFNRFDAGVMAHAGQMSIIGAGAFFRWRFIDSETTRLGAQYAGGFLWSQLSLPAAYQFSQGIWVYTAPSFGLNMTSPYRFPVGLAMVINDLVTLNMEAQVGGGNPECAANSNCTGSTWSGPAMFSGTFGLSIHP